MWWTVEVKVRICWNWFKMISHDRSKLPVYQCMDILLCFTDFLRFKFSQAETAELKS